MFPIDVSQSEDTKVTQNKSTRSFLAIGIVFTLNILSFFFLTPLLSLYINIGVVGRFFLQFLIFICMLIPVIRFYVFEESKKIAEKEDSQSDNFLRYWAIKQIEPQYIKISGYDPIRVFELEDGNVKISFRILFGSNNNSRAKNTEFVLKKLYDTAMSYGLDIQVVTMPEIFRNSKEYSNIAKMAETVKYDKLKQAMLSIVDHVLDVSENESNVDILWVTFITRSISLKFILESIVADIFKNLEEFETSFRTIEALDMQTFLECCRQYYCLEVIDLSLIDPNKVYSIDDEKVKNLVRLYSVTSTTGKTFINEKNLPTQTKAVKL